MKIAIRAMLFRNIYILMIVFNVNKRTRRNVSFPNTRYILMFKCSDIFKATSRDVRIPSVVRARSPISRDTIAGLVCALERVRANEFHERRLGEHDIGAISHYATRESREELADELARSRER